MRKDKNSPAPFTTIGVSSLLVVFIILCLVTFACLSLSTAKSDYEFAQKNAVHKTAYYEACNQAEQNINDLANGKTSKTSWQIKIDNKSALDVAVSGAGNITKWQVISTVEHDYNQPIQLIQ
ncbi:MAG: hypothetical protein MJ144_02845 [Clostridia bacterium]|nr:hypothetical protein [Clostridia bacterium]